jgi:hypothetical protein
MLDDATRAALVGAAPFEGLLSEPAERVFENLVRH